MQGQSVCQRLHLVGVRNNELCNFEWLIVDYMHVFQRRIHDSHYGGARSVSGIAYAHARNSRSGVHAVRGTLALASTVLL